MKSAYRFTLALSVCLLLLVPVSVFAQTTGTVEGAVTDQSNAPLPGVTVELASPNLQGTRTAVTSADGRYRFPSVPPGPYTVTAELAGFGKVQKRATVSLDSTAQVNLSLALSTTAEITVTGEAPMVDSTSTTQGSNYSAKVIEKLPLGRNYADVVFTQPGVQADFGETQGRSLAISIYGSTSSENLFLIDGVNTTNVIKGFQGKDINSEFIQEVEVKTGGYQAEYGRNTGGVVNVITKSGGNEFHGGVFGYYNDTGMRADVDIEQTPGFSEQGTADQVVGLGPNYFNSKEVRQEWGADLGGFVIKDKIWFFGAYDRVQSNNNVEPISGPRAYEQFPQSFVQNKYSGKLTLNPLQGTSIVGSVFSDAQQLNGALAQVGTIAPPAGPDATSYNGRQDTGGPDYGARLNQLFGSFGIFTFQYSQHRDRYTTKPFGLDVPQFRDYTTDPTGTNFTVVGGFGNVFGPTVNNKSLREAYSGSFTAYAGNHEIKIGGDYQNDTTSGTTFFTGGQRGRVRPCQQTGASICDLSIAPFYTNADGTTGQVFYQHDLLADGTTDNYEIIDSFVVQHADETLQRFHPGPVADHPDADHERSASATTPRASTVWIRPPAPSRRSPWRTTGLRASASCGIGRATARPSSTRPPAASSSLSRPTSMSASSRPTLLSRPTTTTRTRSCSSRERSVTDRTPAASPVRENFQGGTASGEPVDGWTNGVKNGTPLTKAAYQDELTLGVEKALDPTLSVGLKGTYRTLGRTVEDRCDLNGAIAPNTCALFNPGGDGQAASGFFPTCNGSGNPTDPTAGECSVDRRRDRRCQAHLPRHRGGGPQTVHQRDLGAGFVPVLVAEGQLLGRHPRSDGSDGPRHQRRLRLLPVHLQRLRQPRARPAGAGPDRRGVERSVRSLDRPRLLRPQRSAHHPPRLVQRLLSGQPLPRAARHVRPDADGLRHEPLAGVQRDRRTGHDHAAALPLQRPQPPDDDRVRHRFQLQRRHRHGYHEPVLRPAGRRARHGKLRSQPRPRPAPTTRISARRSSRRTRGSSAWRSK